ncbi:MAG: hypothetical protein RL262_142 [Bacteroidota bacterium]|jgi:hypothetical protein
MKKIFLLFFIVIAFNASSQSLIGGDNILKTNLSADAINNYNITYEKSINHFISLSVNYKSMPLSKLPLKSIAKKFIDNPAIDFDNFKIGNTTITFEGRFYLGLSKMSGFYIGPYIRYGNYDLSVPASYTYTPDKIFPAEIVKPITAVATLDGTVRTQSYGAHVGMQFQLLTKLVLDISFMGGHYGTSTGKLEFSPPVAFPRPAQDALKQVLDNTKADPFKLKSTVNANKAMVDMEGPWWGLRGLGIGLGLRF